MTSSVRRFFLFLVRVFFREVALNGKGSVPEQGPLIVVANHPNGLVDPVVLGLALRRPIHFLAKSTLFGNPVARFVMRAFRAVPVYRAKEGDTSQNERTFGLCRELLSERGFLALFPEGTSHSAPQLAPLKTGAARIALSAEHATGFKLGVRILPVGLTYEAKETFRSRVSASVGEPFSITDLASAYANDERGTVTALTERIEQALHAVVLEADDTELWRGFVAVARITATQHDMAAIDQRAHQLAEAWRKLRSEHPERGQALADEARALFHALAELGVDDPAALEFTLSARRLVRAVFPMLTLWPIALLGLALYYVPYRAIAPLAVKLSGKETDLVSTMKVLVGLPVFFLTFLGQALVLGYLSSVCLGALGVVLGPLLAFTTLRFFERLSLRRQWLRGIPLSFSHHKRLAALRAHRQTFAAHVEQVLRPNDESQPA